jgi:membrane-associated phospholipid phosphatase
MQIFNKKVMLRMRLPMNYRTCLSCFTLILLIAVHRESSAADFPYELSPMRDGIIISSGLTMQTSAYFLDKRITALDNSEIDALNRDDVNRFDRSATRQWSTSSQKASSILAYTSILAPSICIGPQVYDSKYNESIILTVMFAEAMLVSSGINRNVKNTVQRKRPYVYNSSISYEDRHDESSDAKKSFYSSHTSFAFCAATFTTKIFSDIYPATFWRYVVSAGTFSLAATVGFLRYKGGMHYPTDILAGAVMGSATGYLVPWMHEGKSSVTIIPILGESYGLAVRVGY